MKLNRCNKCGKFPFVSTQYQYFNDKYAAQVVCKCSHRSEVFVSDDKQLCIEDAVENWNEWHSAPDDWAK